MLSDQTRTKRSALRFAKTAAATLGILVMASSAQAGDQVYRVDLNKTQILRLPASAGAVVVGNPRIADVSVHSPNTLFVVGRGFGETNLIILDREGRTMMDADIQVMALTPSHGVRIYNAKNRETYSCAPYCQPSPVLGDNPEFIGSNAVQDVETTPTGAIFETSTPAPTTESGGLLPGEQPEFFSAEEFASQGF